MTTPESRSTASLTDSFRRGAAFTAGAAIVALLVLLAWLAIGVLVLVFVAVLLGAALEPVVGWLRTHLPVGRSGGILLAYGAFFVSVALLALVAVPVAISQLDDLASEVPRLLDQARAWAQGLEPKIVSMSLTSLIDTIDRALDRTPAPQPNQVVQAGITVAEAVVALATLLTVVFFWLTEHARIQRYALAFVPQDRRAGTHDAWNEVESRLGLWVRGQLLVMGSVALGTGVIYTVLGVPSALLLAIFAGLAEVIPLVGPIIGAIPAMMVAATVSPQLVVMVAIAYLVIQFVEGNVLIPLIMRNTIGISPFLVLVSILIGGVVGGILGAFLAVPIAAAADVILERAQAREVPVAQVPDETEPENAEKKALRERSLDAPGVISTGKSS
jgi:predicted PurR-regulated permease PerM